MFFLTERLRSSHRRADKVFPSLNIQPPLYCSALRRTLQSHGPSGEASDTADILSENFENAN